MTHFRFLQPIVTLVLRYFFFTNDTGFKAIFYHSLQNIGSSYKTTDYRDRDALVARSATAKQKLASEMPCQYECCYSVSHLGDSLWSGEGHVR